MFDGNRVTAHTRSRYPIFQSPMTWIACSPLVTAVVSKAGAMGLLENSIRDLEVTKKEFYRDLCCDQPAIRRQPADLLLPADGIPGLRRRRSSTGCSARGSISSPLRPAIRRATTKLLKARGRHGLITPPRPLRGAQKAVDAGVDGLIVEGAESAGVRNPDEVHSFALLQAVREKVDVPIVAAGGVVDGRGMAAAFALGAEGVTMGTRFVASVESPVHPNYKNAIVEAPITGTIMTDNPPRARSRGLRTAYSVEVAEGKRERLPRNATLDMLYVQGDVDNTSGAAGESAGLIHELKSVQQIVDDTIASFWREIDRLASLRRPASSVRAG